MPRKRLSMEFSYVLKVSTLDENKFISSLRTVWLLCAKLRIVDDYASVLQSIIKAKKNLFLYYIKQKDSMCSVIDHSMVS